MVQALIDLAAIIAGHGYDTGSAPRRESAVDDGGGGIGTVSIVIVLVLAAVTVAMLVHADPGGAKAKLRALAPRGLIVVVIAAPLILWTAFPGGDPRSLVVERATGVTGAPELLVALADEELNTLEQTGGVRTVRVECFGDDGRTVVGGDHRWPFAGEEGFEVPHAHQPATAEQVRRAGRCRVSGTRAPLEADVEGRPPT